MDAFYNIMVAVIFFGVWFGFLVLANRDDGSKQ